MYIVLDCVKNYVCEKYIDENGKKQYKKEKGVLHKFIESHDGDYEDLFGKKYLRSEINFDDVVNFKEYLEEPGSISIPLQYIHKNYPYREETNNRELGLKIAFLDIEVSSVDSFPDPNNPVQDIQLIGITVNDKTTIFGIKELDKNDNHVSDLDFEYVYCKNQVELLSQFILFLRNNDVDIITGWNSKEFDIPYIVNKARLIEKKDKKYKEFNFSSMFSPFYKLFKKEKKISLIYENKNGMKICGLPHLDYYLLYKKFRMKPRESYKLDFIGQEELNLQKESFEEYKDLNELYEQNFPLFVRYNFRDIEIVKKLEEKLGLIVLATTISYFAGINFEDVFSPIKTWDAIIYNHLMNKRKIVKSGKFEKNNESFPGAYVFDPVLGFSEWVVSFDVDSMYPSIIRSYNMSYETIIENDRDLNQTPYSGELCNSSYSNFKKDEKGLFPSVLENVMQDRNRWKKEKFENQLKLNEIEKEIERRQL